VEVATVGMGILGGILAGKNCRSGGVWTHYLV
jgi:hypothetical protein